MIDRRLGIPITLSVLMIAVGRRLGIDVQGVGMPGHFLVLDGGAATCGAIRSTVARDSTPPGAGAASISSTAARCRSSPAFSRRRRPTRSWRMLANLERSKLATDPVQRAWMCGLHLDIPGITAEERMQLADQLAATGDVMRAAREFDRLADEADADVATRLRTRVRALRAGMN